MLCEFLHCKVQGPARSCLPPHEEVAEQGEEVVAAFCCAFQVNRSLKLVSELMRNGILVIFAWNTAKDISGRPLREVNAVCGGMGYSIPAVAVKECGIVEITRIESVATCEIVRSSCFFSVGNSLADAAEVLFPYRTAVSAASPGNTF